MADAVRTRYVAECFWAGVQEEDLQQLAGRVEAAVARTPRGLEPPVRFLGWLRVLDDEVVLVLFEGPIATVRRVAQDAGVPFERLLRASHALRPDQIAEREEPQ